MAQWQRHLDIKDVWESNNVPLIAKALSERLRALRPMDDEDLDETRIDLADQFDSIANDPKAGTSEFDTVIDELYNWGDTRLDNDWNGKKVCWIATF